MQYESTTLHPAADDLTGKPFERWTVLHFAGYSGAPYYIAYWTCQCVCGTIKDVSARNLRSHQVKSCGCLRIEQSTKLNTTHGKSKTPEFSVWQDMLRRCNDPKREDYPAYGGRGLTVCTSWHDFAAFLADMGPRPSPKHKVERLNNDIGYTPENCIWATMRTQARNTRRNHLITCDNKTQCIAAWVDDTGIPEYILRYRHRMGWSDEDTIKTPYNKRK